MIFAWLFDCIDGAYELAVSYLSSTGNKTRSVQDERLLCQKIQARLTSVRDTDKFNEYYSKLKSAVSKKIYIISNTSCVQITLAWMSGYYFFQTIICLFASENLFQIGPAILKITQKKQTHINIVFYQGCIVN